MGIFFSTVTSLSPLQSIRGENSHSHDPRSPELCSGGGTKSYLAGGEGGQTELVMIGLLTATGVVKEEAGGWEVSRLT